ncbi:MAG TPA: PAS domain S-box protein [Verrucomicrobiae bacterium]|nr:PAS domain S-box protein [Verrucomicrobiae bacterium]
MNKARASLLPTATEGVCPDEQYLRSKIENASDILSILESNGLIRYESPAVEHVLGYKPEELIGRNAFELVHPDDLARIQIIFHEGLNQSGAIRCGEFRYRHKDGSWRVFEAIGRNLMDDPAIRGVIVSSRDITERKRMDDALRTSEERYRNLFGTMQDGFALCEIICDADGKPCDFRYLEANSAFEVNLGIGTDQVLGKTAREVFPNIEEYWITTYGEVALTGKPVRFENYLRAMDKHFRVTAYCPKPGQFAAIFRDVTQQRQTEERLRLQGAALEAAANGVVITDRKGTIVWTNPAFSQLTGYTGDEALGRNPKILRSGAHGEEFYVDLWKTISEGRVWRGDLVNRRKDGSLYNEEMTITPVRNEHGEITHFVAIKQDASMRQQTEQALRESEELFRSLSASSPLGIFLTDTRGQFTYINPRCRQILGCSLIESQNNGWIKCLHPDDRDAAWQHWLDYVQSGKGEYSYEYRIQNPDGTTRFAHMRAAPLRSDEPVPTGFVGSLEDITHHRRAEDELRESKQNLEHAMQELKAAHNQVVQQERLRALGTMASGIAHDFNNALAAILGFTELLCHRPENLSDTKKTLRYLQMMNTAAQDAGIVVNRLREFYRQREEGDVFTPVDLNKLIEQSISLTQPKWKNQAEAKGVTIQIATKQGEVPRVIGSEPDLREALTNLIFNAVDAMPNGGSITVRTRAQASRVELEVTDTGTGMTEDVRQRCLEPFFTTKGDRGTGLGLSMVYGIVQRHQGTVEIDTTLGKGTTFRLSLPAAQQTKAANTDESTTAKVRPLSILLVDDEEIVRQILREYLVGDGHTVDSASNGPEALDKVPKTPFDLVILDRAMPGMSGDQVALGIKAVRPDLPVILLTGFGNMMQAAGETPPGIDLILSKPVTIAGLRSGLAQVVKP